MWLLLLLCVLHRCSRMMLQTPWQLQCRWVTRVESDITACCAVP